MNLSLTLSTSPSAISQPSYNSDHLTPPSYLADPNDIKILARSARLLQQIAQTEPLKSFVDPKGDANPKVHHHLEKWSDEDIENDIRRRAETLYHPCSSARMAPKEDGGVVDPFLRVYGIQNLRIADAAVFPSIVSGHTVRLLDLI